jgi:ELWxxDGT repeat protein
MPLRGNCKPAARSIDNNSNLLHPIFMLSHYFSPRAQWHPRHWCVLWFLLAAPLAAAQPTLVKDIVPSGTDPLTGAGSFAPGPLAGMNGVAYFAAFDPTNGRELWRSDGTPAGTVLLKDILAGATGSEPADLAVVNNTLYFSANDGKSGRELWKSDGTAAGTVRVKDILAGTGGAAPTSLVGMGNALYFSATDGTAGRELWKSDGTSAGTVRVKDIWAGAAHAAPYALTNASGTLYFVANDGVSGFELWKSNGTAAGTMRVQDLAPGSVSAFDNTPYLTPVNGMLYFVADNGQTGTELWKSNGTAAGTVSITEFSVPSFSGGPWNLTNVNGTLYFSAYGDAGVELYKSNGTAAGTVLVKDIEPYAFNRWYTYEHSSPEELTNVNGTLYFTATRSDDQSGRELWKSNGTAAGTVMVADLFPGTYTEESRGYGPYGEWPNDGNPGNLTNVNGTLYCTTARGLWKSEGGSMVLLKELSEATNLANVNGTLFLAARDNASGVDLWKSNGTAAGTVLVEGKPSSIAAGSYPQHGVNVGGTLYFAAGNAARGYELWKSNGTNAGTTLVKKIGPVLRGLSNAGGKLYFVGSDGTNGPEVWKSDGTAAGTTMVKDIYYGAGGSSPYGFTALNGIVYFAAEDNSHGTELWRSDGTAAGTYRVKDIYPGDEVYYDEEVLAWQHRYLSSAPSGLTALNGKLYFIANSSYGEGELWGSDGTEAGTALVKDIYPGNSWSEKPNGSESRYLTNLNGTLYFSGTNGGGHSLWKSNGTEAGTVEVKDTPTRQILKAGNWLYFWGDGGQLWRSNGTPAGTTPVASIAGDTNEQFLTAVGNVVYFVADQAATGRELWRTDGTAAGTYLLGNITPGATGTDINSFAALGSELYFSAAPAGGTTALWKSNGTTAGTVKVSSLEVANLVAMSGVLYFSGNNGTSGFELWRYNPASCLSPPVATALQGSTVCQGSSATVTVKAAPAGVRYGLYFGASAIGPQKVGNGTDLAFSVPAASLLTGSYVFTVKAEGCREVTLTQTATVTVTAPLAAPAASGVTVNSGQTATLTASGAPAGATYRWYAAASGGTPLATTATYTTPALSSTTTYYVAVYQLPCGESPRRAVTITVNGGMVAKSFRVNAGGSAFSTIDARNFAADVYFAGGVVTTPTSLAIAGTGDDFLYQTGRHGSAFAYNFPTGNGSYDVTLHFAETYYGNTAPGGAGSRKFHVDAEGVRRLTDYDVFAKAGGALRARQETFRVNVGDGTLNVAFLKGSADNPAVKAIEVLPAGSALAINSGGSAFTTGAGKRFAADVYYADGSPSTAVSGDVLNTTDDYLYQTGRSGPAFSYGLPSGNGTFDVTLHFAETYYGNRVAGGVGSRKFNVYLEGVKHLADYDIYAKAGGAMRAVKETRRVTVTDGVLNLYFAKGSAGDAFISAVEVVPAAVAAREGADGETVAEEWQVHLYPNPVQDELFVRLPFAAAAVKGTTIANAAGAALLTDCHRVTAEGSLLFRVGELKRGLYLLHLDTRRGHRVIKFVKQ